MIGKCVLFFLILRGKCFPGTVLFSYKKISLDTCRVFFRSFGIILWLFSLIYLFKYFVLRLIMMWKSFLYILSFITGTTVVVLFNIFFYFAKLVFFVVSRFFLLICYLFLFTNLIVVVDVFFGILWVPIYAYLLLYKYVLNKFLYPFNFVSYTDFLYVIIVGFYILIKEYLPLFLKFSIYIWHNFNFFIYIGFSLFIKNLYIFVLFCIKKSIISLIRLVIKRIQFVKIQVNLFINAFCKFCFFIYTKGCLFVLNFFGFLWFHVILSYPIKMVKFLLIGFRFTVYLVYMYIEFIFWYYMFCIYMFIRFCLFVVHKFLITIWMIIFHTIRVIHSIKMFYMYIKDLYSYLTSISPVHVIKEKIHKFFTNLLLFFSKIRVSPRDSWKYVRSLNSFDVLLLILGGFNKLRQFGGWIISIITKFLLLIKRVLLVILWPVLLIIRIIYSILRPFLKPFVVFWEFLVVKTIPLRNFLDYKFMFPKRSPLEELNQEEIPDIAGNADFFNQNVNTVLHPLFKDVMGENVHEFMFDSMEPGELFRNDFEFLDTDQFSFVYAASPNDYASQVHADFYGILNMLSLEDILKDPNVAGFDPFEGAAFSRETFTILGYLESLVRSFSTVKEIGKEDFKEEGAFVHLPDESVEVSAGYYLKKRISWFLTYYKFISKRFDLFMNGQLKDSKESKEFFRKEKIFSKQYLRRHTFRRRLVFNSETRGFLHLTPTFLSKAESFLKKDISEYFLIYGDPQFALESRYSNRMLFHGILNLVVLFFIVAYVVIPNEEIVLFYHALIVTVVVITVGLLIMIYFSIFKRRYGLLSRKGLNLDGSFRLLAELVGGWAIIMFFIGFFYFYDIFIIGWDAVDIKFLLEAYSNESFLFDWLINIMSEEDDFLFDDYFKPMFSMIERSQMLNKGIWNGQFYNPCYILYAKDLRYTEESFISYAVSHYIYLWQNVPSPIIAIIGDTCMLLKQRYSDCSVSFVSDFVKDLPSSFEVQNYLLDIKYKIFYSNLLKLDVFIFKYLKANLSTGAFDYVCIVTEWIAFCFAHLRLLLMLIFQLDMQYASISFTEFSNIKMAQFEPQIKKLEEDILNRNIETITKGSFFEGILTLLDVELPESARDFKNFEYGKLFLTLFWYLFNFCFFDIYTLLGLPLAKPIGFILPEYFGEEIEDVKAGMYQTPGEFGIRDYLHGYDEDLNRDDKYLISSHDLLDDYANLEGDLHLKGHDLLRACRFALSPALTDYFPYANSSETSVWLSSSLLRKLSAIFRCVKDWTYFMEYYSPWDKVFHSQHNLDDKRFRAYSDRYYFGSEQNLQEIYKLYILGYRINLFARIYRPWYLLDLIHDKEFLLRTSFTGNFALFDLSYDGPDTIAFSMYRTWTVDDWIWSYHFSMPATSTQNALDLWADRFVIDYVILNNWNDDDFFKYGSTIQQLEWYTNIHFLERHLRGTHNYKGGYYSNALFFYYHTLAQCLYNESFFTQHYKYPLFFNIPDNSNSFKDTCFREYVKTNILMCDRYNTGWAEGMDFDRRYYNNYEHIAEGSWDLCYRDLDESGYHTVEVPKTALGDIGVINRAANIFDFYFDKLLHDDALSNSDDNIYLRLVAGDEYVLNPDGDHPIIYGKFYDGFIYYLIERDGLKFIVPVDSWLREDVFFNHKFLPHYDVDEKIITMLSLDERYFKILAELDFDREQKQYCLNTSVRCPMILLNMQEALLDGFIDEPSQVLENAKCLTREGEKKTEKSLTIGELFREIQTLNYWTGLFKKWADFAVLEKPIRNRLYQDFLTEFIKYRVTYLRKIDNRIDMTGQWLLPYPMAIQVRNLSLMAEEFKVLSDWWEECNEYLWDIREEIEEYGADDYCKRYHRIYSTFMRLYEQSLLQTQYHVDPTVNRYDEWSDAIQERKELINAFYSLPIEITSPYLVDCKQALVDILKSECETDSKKNDDICFYNFYMQSFKNLLNQSIEVQLCTYLCTYEMPKYSEPLIDFFDLSS